MHWFSLSYILLVNLFNALEANFTKATYLGLLGALDLVIFL